jgi:transcriptional regulator with XRE-family HTH domain
MLSEKIKKLRLAQNISQVELGKSLGVSKQCISNWENDNILPSIYMLIKLADYFSVSTDYLLCRDDKRYIDVTGLSDTKIAHLQQIAEDMKVCN